MSQVSEFNAYRERMNDRLLQEDNKVLKRFFSLDNQAYQDGALSEKNQGDAWISGFDGASL